MIKFDTAGPGKARLGRARQGEAWHGNFLNYNYKDKKRMVYKFKRSIKGYNAQEVGEYIEQLTGRDGITPDKLLAASKGKRSLLHDYFEWDDKNAAHKHRLSQASYLLRIIVVEDDNDAGDDDVVSVRAFVPVSQEDESHYVTIDQAMSDADMRMQVLARAKRELKSFRDKYETFKEFKRVIAAIDKV